MFAATMANDHGLDINNTRFRIRNLAVALDFQPNQSAIHLPHNSPRIEPTQRPSSLSI